MTVVCLPVQEKKGEEKGIIKLLFYHAHSSWTKVLSDKNEAHFRFLKVEEHNTDNGCKTKNSLLPLCSDENKEYTYFSSKHNLILTKTKQNKKKKFNIHWASYPYSNRRKHPLKQTLSSTPKPQKTIKI